MSKQWIKATRGGNEKEEKETHRHTAAVLLKQEKNATRESIPTASRTGRAASAWLL